MSMYGLGVSYLPLGFDGTPGVGDVIPSLSLASSTFVVLWFSYVDYVPCLFFVFVLFDGP